VSKKKGDSVVLLSGGLDSAVVLAMELKAGRKVRPLYFDYGQPQHFTEMAHTRAILKHLGLHEAIAEYVSLVHYWKPYSHDGNFDYPMRNVIFISIAVNYAYGLGIPRVVTGIRNSIYADTTCLFVDVFGGMVSTLAQDKVQVEHPIYWMTKSQVLKKALKLGVEPSLTYSCIRGDEPCGECPSCKARKRLGI